MIKAQSISKTYYQGKTRIEAVRDITLEIQKGQSVLIAGSSGAGKSTLLHLLGGLDRPTAGKLFLNGVDFYSQPDRIRSAARCERIGFVFQFYHLLPEFTVLENVMLPALINARRSHWKMSDIKKEVERLLEMVGLTHRSGHRPSELSGGESQRVAIARSLINSPDVLLCDEPTGNLDSKRGGEIINCLWSLKESRSMALVIVTHNEHIRDGFDKRFRIEDGILKEAGGETPNTNIETRSKLNSNFLNSKHVHLEH